MNLSLQEAVAMLLSYGQWWALPLLAAAACVEYIFPPFPGDTVVLGGAVLAYLGGWNIPLLFTALLTGNLVGAAVDYTVGKKLLGEQQQQRFMAGHEHRRKTLQKILGWYRRFGPAVLILNRFLPGIRPLFFVAAGSAGFKLPVVLFYAAISGLAWTGLLVVLGFIIGDNLALLEHILHTYFYIVGVLVVLFTLHVIFKWTSRK
jgi:membrane protein DedA with SNARE-associated domain